MVSKVFESLLKETTYHFNIYPIDRSWIITPKGEIWSDISHRFMLKSRFKSEWDILKQRDLAETDIEEIFMNRLLLSGHVKIGELDSFYAISEYINSIEKYILQGFARSLLKIPEKKLTAFRIHQRFNNRIFQTTVGELANDILREVQL